MGSRYYIGCTRDCIEIFEKSILLRNEGSVFISQFEESTKIGVHQCLDGIRVELTVFSLIYDDDASETELC